MRRATLDILRCPRCLNGGLVPEDPVAEPRLIFGPVRCLGCVARFPVGEGMIDFVGDRDRPPGLQGALESPWVARSYERYVRPALEVFLTRGQFDRDSEYLIYRSLLGRPTGAVVDLGCGTGLFARRLVRDLEAQVIGVDVSKPMIEEAIAQAREAAVAIDFVRAEAPSLSFQSASVAAVLQAGSLHFIRDLKSLLAEIARVLKPGGRYVASHLLVPPLLGPFHAAAGVHPRSERLLRDATEAAGLVRFERVKVAQMVMFKVERP
jgi:ubiquinone/menaquinone biosynthesis C-methylase UbiE